ncbi:Flp family type IVb pilin [Streptomyces sp. NPDC047725]|uniref:Flp family type IVb pilin n=1 Tax=Streptomyces sp. NPDC047725 TaxID=3365487 RepID=UPI0037102E03
MNNWLRTKAARLHTHDDRGQTAVEYLGIIAVVVAIVLAITGTDIGNTIYTAITDKVNEVINGG